MLATYVHDLDPVALPIYGGLALRWYGLAYLMGFVAGFLLLKNLAQRGLWVLKPEKTADFIAACALFGVFLGGRLGYILLYFKDGAINWEWFGNLFSSGQNHVAVSLVNAEWVNAIAQNPSVVFRVWEGGMASHGGILGLAIFTWIYAKKNKVSWAGLADGLCVVGPLGLFFGRMANFINGELYGRVADGVAWAVKFPKSLELESQDVQGAAWQACTQVEPSLAKATSLDQLVTVARENPKVSETLGEFLQPRHPSQIYEGLLEGLLLFLILYTVRVKFKNAPTGLITGLFFALYAIFRILGEQFREPDAELVRLLTKGQFFSIFMFLFAAAFFVHAWREARKGLTRG
ncbi:prolipoprotein diacylglyceryl transferase [Luteolibacter yonseiensis]|uniref:Phosphatidylglycerol--prolipoprotein diacylglyceryl transferase n=1 Tax=Luteolibacter yonseiensis TaxID=1144680 RepID=A0A934R6Y0_9BACT|nr:prolipoprotein diacylglyceryl transferase [Luteolibacter yonseiensis]MBK1817093.1 prolipoprotein diacylglyceryl transferase [Luteolibacter yonseiensis]